MAEDDGGDVNLPRNALRMGEDFKPNSDEHKTEAQSGDPELVHGSSQSPDINDLRTLIEVVESNLTDSFETCTDALRAIGNACIGNDQVRDNLTTLGFNWALRCLSIGDEDLRILTIKVLYNACADHEAAQKGCLMSGIHLSLIRVLSTKARVASQVDEWAGDLWELTAELLFDICGHVKEFNAQETLPEDIIGQLLWLPTVDFQKAESQSLESYASLIETAQIFLRYVHNQRKIVETRVFGDIWRVYLSIEYRLDQSTKKFTSELDKQVLIERRQLLLPLSASFTWILSDIAALKEFTQQYPIQDDFIQNLLSLLIDTDLKKTTTGGQDPSTTERIANAACQIIGNVLWNSTAQACLLLMETSEQPQLSGPSASSERVLHASLLKILVNSQSGELLHSAIGLLIQLTRPNPIVREVLGRDARTALERVCKHERPEIRQGAIKLIRALGKDCLINQERFRSLAEETLQSLSQPAKST